MRLCFAGPLVLLGFVPGSGLVAAGQSPADKAAVGGRAWDQVKVVVARNHVERLGSFWNSLHWWADERAAKNPEMGERIAIEGNAVETLFVGARSVVHIHGDLSGSLRVGEHSEVVVGGNIAKEGRIQADGIVAIHVQGSLNGVIECHSMAGVWVGGDLRGQVLTGEPSMFLRVKGNLEGTVRPVDKAALLAIDVEGDAASSVVKVIDGYNYTELNMSAARSDLSAGIHRLWSGRSGFVAVTAAQ